MTGGEPEARSRIGESRGGRPSSPGRGERGVSIWSLEGKVVVITEKPKAASKIALALSPNHSRGKLYNVPYYVIRSNRSTIYVVPSAGHLYDLYTSDRKYPVFEYYWKPLYQVDRSAKHAYNYLRALEAICKKADFYVNACDYDIEGSVIGYLIIKFNGDLRRSFRAKFSSLAPSELRESFERLSELDWEMIEAGLCRHELDWLWGINVSRALMDVVQRASGRRVRLSAGRVQTPTLKRVVDSDISRNLHVPVPTYTLQAAVVKEGLRVQLEYVGPPIESRREAQELLEALRASGKLVVSSYDERAKRYSPPPAFSLGDLQSEAARIYGFSPYRTQKIAEKLYLDALISYPRTNSQKLPPTINYKSIIEKLGRVGEYSSLVGELLEETRGQLRPVQGRKEDPAHPAIHPTGVLPRELSGDERKIFDLIVRRFLAAFSSSAVVNYREAVLKHPSLDKLVFRAVGQQVLARGWLKYYAFRAFEERRIPKLSVGEEVLIDSAEVLRQFTKPPSRLSRIKLLKWMESVEIGTESTRARIIELLFRRNYLRSVSGAAEATELGFGVIEVLDEHFSELTSVELTRFFEKEMESIRAGEKRREEVVAEARKTISELLEKFRAKAGEVGRLLSVRLGRLRPSQTCLICDREAWRERLCKYHYLAREELRKQYKLWEAREGISWREYLETIKKLESTGKWIREVIVVAR